MQSNFNMIILQDTEIVNFLQIHINIPCWCCFDHCSFAPPPQGPQIAKRIHHRTTSTRLDRSSALSCANSAASSYAAVVVTDHSLPGAQGFNSKKTAGDEGIS